jgi:hypothetical protein
MSSSLLHQLQHRSANRIMSLFHQRYVEVLGFLKKDIQSAIVWPVPRRTGLAETGTSGVTPRHVAAHVPGGPRVHVVVGMLLIIHIL